MNISYAWLRTLAPTISGEPKEIADRLGMLGAPVDDLAIRGAGLADILVARVEAVRPHPNADRLRLCTVDAGGEPLQVVCGAPNVVAGGRYPFAPVGATLPGGSEIRKAKIRGETSEGMLCSASELGLGRDHAGLMTLTGEWRAGSRLLDNVELEDASLVLDITPNRGDLLSHIGVARELAPGGNADITLKAFSSAAPSMRYQEGEADIDAATIRLRIEDPADCPRYVGAIVEGIRVGPSPEWLTARLRAIGSRPINNIVDATNFVLYELGQPLHAFDLDTLDGSEIQVRRARPGETLRTLDGIERKLAPSMLVIADRSRPVALAGVMGGLETEVTESTTRLLIECALFDPRRVRTGAKQAGLSTEASHRYERGVDPEGQRRAIERVCDLIVAVAGGSVVSPILDAHPRPHEPVRIAVRPDRVRRLLGVDLSAEEIGALLTPIGFGTESRGEDLDVLVPSFRPDVTREIDVVEEVARRRGYDSFGAELRSFRTSSVPVDSLEGARRAVHQIFARWGFFEARTAAFAPARDGRVPLLNPLSGEESHLRDDLISGLLRRVEYNWTHGVRSIRLFEIGSVFSIGETGSPPLEELRLAAVFTGPRRPPHWSDPPIAFDVWDLKGLMEELALPFGYTIGYGTSDGPMFHGIAPSESLRILNDTGELVGGGGLISPRVLDAPAWADGVWGLEVAMRLLQTGVGPAYRPLPAFPAVERDIALLVPSDLLAATVEETIARGAGPFLESTTTFDVYDGIGLDNGKRSIAWRLRFRHPERTLTDPEVEESVAKVLTVLREEHGIERR